MTTRNHDDDTGTDDSDGDQVVSYLTKEDAGSLREKKQVVVDRELDRIYKDHGTVTTDILLDEARDPESPLHPFFEWNNDVAAEKYRQAQAYAMILASKMVLVIEQSEDGPPKIAHAQNVEVRRLVSPFRNEGFKMRKEALDETDMRRAMIEKKISVLRSWCRETTDYDELSAIRESILNHLEVFTDAAE